MRACVKSFKKKEAKSKEMKRSKRKRSMCHHKGVDRSSRGQRCKKSSRDEIEQVPNARNQDPPPTKLNFASGLKPPQAKLSFVGG